MELRLGRALLALTFVSFACSKKAAAPPEVSGLAAVPASAEVVVVADVAKVAASPLVVRAAEELLGRDHSLAERWQKLRDSCKIDFTAQVKHVVLAIGPKPSGEGSNAPPAAPGSGPVLMVVTGKLAEAELAACVRTMVGQGGGSLTAKDHNGRTLYQARDGNRIMFFAFGKPDTVVMGSIEAWVTEALGPGKKLDANPDMQKWMALADRNMPMWAAGKVDELVGRGIVRATEGKVSSGPVAIVMSADASKGAKFELALVMASADDAKALESFVKGNLAMLAMAAQVKGLQKVVEHVSIGSDGAILRIKARLEMEDVNQLISTLDAGGSPEQDSPPAAGK